MLAVTPNPTQEPHTPSRRVLRWERIQGPRAVAATIISTAVGAGLFPLAPGTMGSIVALPLVFLTSDVHWLARIVLWTAILLAGTWAAKNFDEIMHSEDNQNIVIDEVLGMGITAWTAGKDMKTLVVAFVIFRILDIVKPFPIRKIDLWSKKKASEGNHWAGGLGVMLDDVLAGVQGLIIIMLLQYLDILP